MIKSVRATDDPELDKKAYDKTRKEIDLGYAREVDLASLDLD